MSFLSFFFQACAVIESAAGASQEVDSGASRPQGDHTPSRPVTSEPEKADRVERPLSSE